MRPRSVTASVIAGFGACLLVLVALMVWATNAAFEHERTRAESALDAAARTEAPYRCRIEAYAIAPQFRAS